MDSYLLIKLIKAKTDFFLPIILFCWLLFYIGNQTTLQGVCKTYNSSLYFYINHDFRTVKQFSLTNNEYHCLKQIEVPTCFAGQKQILFEKKCKINEQIGVKYGYIK